MTVPRPGRGHPEAGMTVTELLVTIAIMTIITGAVSMALLVTMGPDRQAAARVATAHDAQLVALYLTADVLSALDVDDAAGSALDECAGTEPGSNELLLTWSQSVSGTDYAVSYRVLEVGDEWQLIRYSCEGGATADQIVVARNLLGSSAVNVTVTARRITVALTDASESVATFTAFRRTPSTVCAVTAHAASTASVALDSLNRLADTVTVTASTEGPCSGLRLHYDRGSGPQSVAFAGTTATLPPGETWTVGDYQLTVLDPSTGSEVLAESTLTVTPPPCEATVTATPASVPLTATGDLTTTVEVSATTTGTCGALELAFVRNTTDTEQVIAMGSGPYAATIPVAGPWDVDDSVDLFVRDAGAGPVAGSTSFQTTAYVPCSVTSASADPASIARTATQDLSGPVTITATTIGACGALEAIYQRSGSDAVQVLPLGSGPSYSDEIPVAGPWDINTSPGVTVSIREVGTTAVLGTATFTVTAAPCSITSVTPSPSSVNRMADSGANRRLSQPVTVTVLTSGDCTDLDLTFQRTTNPNTAQVVDLQQTGTTFTYVIPGGAIGTPTWTSGNKTLTVLSGGIAQSPTGTLVVNP